MDSPRRKLLEGVPRAQPAQAPLGKSLWMAVQGPRGPVGSPFTVGSGTGGRGGGWGQRPQGQGSKGRPPQVPCRGARTGDSSVPTGAHRACAERGLTRGRDGLSGRGCSPGVRGLPGPGGRLLRGRPGVRALRAGVCAGASGHTPRVNRGSWLGTCGRQSRLSRVLRTFWAAGVRKERVRAA